MKHAGPAAIRLPASGVRRLVLSFLLVPLLTAGLTAAEPLQEARAAIERGDGAVAFELLSPLAAAGEVRAQTMMGALFQAGVGVPQDFASAAGWYRRAAAGGDPEAQHALASLHVRGLGVARDDAEAFRLFEAAAAHGEAKHQFDLALMYDNGIGVTRDPVKAAAWYAKAAAQGLAAAQTSLGVLYQSGDGVVRDLRRAADLYRRAADEGDARAQNNLGLLYLRGEGVTQDLDSAALWFQVAAGQGLDVAAGNLAVMYDNGFGVAQDDAAAAELYRFAARRGVAPIDRLEWLEPLYDPRLTPVPEDPEAAMAYRRDAQRGDPLAQFILAFLLGRPGPRHDPVEAAAWYRRAAEAGLPMAMANLGLAHAQGRGVPQDYVLSYRWANLAAARGLSAAHELRRMVAQRMTAGQLNEAQAASSGLRPASSDLGAEWPQQAQAQEGRRR